MPQDPPGADTPAPPDKPQLRQMNVRLPPDLIAAIDVRRAQVRGGMTRDRWVAAALADALRRTPATLTMATRPGQRTAPPPHHRPQGGVQ